MGWGVGWGSIPIHHHMTAVVGVPLPPWPEHIRYMALLSMMPSILWPIWISVISWPVACFASTMYNVLFFRGPVLCGLSRRNSATLFCAALAPASTLLQGCSLFLNHGQETRAERLPGMNDASGLT